MKHKTRKILFKLCLILIFSVPACYFSGCSDTSAPTSSNSVPLVPVLAYPDSGGNVSASPVMQWNKSVGATSYNLQIADNSLFANPKINTTGIKDTYFQVPYFVLNYGSMYYWRVSATSPSGTSVFSAPWNFSTVTEPLYDTNVISFDFLIKQWNSSSSMSATDLYLGKIVTDLNISRDLQLRSQNGQNENFYFRDGTFDTPLGYECRMKKLYDNIYDSQFDSITVIPGGLAASNFPYNSTESFGYFNNTQNQFMVIAFYLKGKYEHSVSPYPVYGILYLYSSMSGNQGFAEWIRVRINIAGKNSFKIQ